MPKNTSTGKLGRQQMIVIARCGGFLETKGNANRDILPFPVPQLSNPPGFNL
jgi:hypothetical protein